MNNEREKIITWLKDKIDRNIVFDSVPENDNGWHEVERESVVKILDGLIPMLKTEVKKLNIPDVSQQREQLINFLTWHDSENLGRLPTNIADRVDEYLKLINCG